MNKDYLVFKPLPLHHVPPKAHDCPLCKAGVPLAKKTFGPFEIEDEKTGEKLGILLSEETFRKMQESLDKLDYSGRVRLILRKNDVLQERQDHEGDEEVRQGREGDGGSGRDDGKPGGC